MGDTYKLRVRVGDHEFDAEGPAEEVKAQFEEWKELISQAPTGGGPRRDVTQRQDRGATGIDTEASARILRVDQQRGMVSLRALPTGDRREADAALLILYGFHRLLDQDDVLVGRVKDGLEQSGFQPNRIDRVVAPHVNAGLIMKAGRGPGGRYWLSNTGVTEAERLLSQLGGG